MTEYLKKRKVRETGKTWVILCILAYILIMAGITGGFRIQSRGTADGVIAAMFFVSLAVMGVISYPLVRAKDKREEEQLEETKMERQSEQKEDERESLYRRLGKFTDTVLFEYRYGDGTILVTPNASAQMEISVLRNALEKYVKCPPQRGENRCFEFRMKADTESYRWCICHVRAEYGESGVDGAREVGTGEGEARGDGTGEDGAWENRAREDRAWEGGAWEDGAQEDGAEHVGTELPVCLIGKLDDISKLKEREEQLLLQSTRDGLTGVYNKTAFEYMMEETLKRGSQGCLYMIDIDNFKEVNDQYGHPAGDKILVKTGELLREIFRDSDLIGRVGGDEFVVYSESRDTKLRALKLLNGTEDFTKDGEMRISVSIGIASSTGELDEEYQELFSRADQAMYRAKQEGKNRITWYEE